MPYLRIVLKKDGGISSEAKEFQGDDCQKVLRHVDDLFGEPAEHVLKESFNEEKERTRDHIGTGNGYCG